MKMVTLKTGLSRGRPRGTLFAAVAFYLLGAISLQRVRSLTPGTYGFLRTQFQQHAKKAHWACGQPPVCASE